MHRTVFDEKTKIWKGGGKVDEVDKTMSAGTAILKALESHPDNIGQICDNNGVQLTNKEIRVRIIRAAQNLLKLGLKTDDVIQTYATNHQFLAPFVFGAVCIGAPINGLGATLTKEDIVYMVNLARPKLILCDSDIIRTVEEALQLVDFYVLAYTFDGANNPMMIDELFNETHCENDGVEA